MQSVDRQLLKLLMSRDFFLANRDRVAPAMFEGEAKTLYLTIEAAHARYLHDLSAAEVMGLLRTEHPTLPRAARNACHEIMDDVDGAEPITPDVAADVLATAWRLQVFREVAEIAIAGTLGAVPDLDGIRQIIERCGEHFAPAEDFDEVPRELDDILAAVDDAPQWTFNVPTVADRLPGMSGGQLLLFLARPETGKSAAPVSLACSPGGWCDQGARVAIFCNEEPGIRTKLRAVCAALQKPEAWVRENRDEARAAWARIKDRLTVLDGDPAQMTMARIDGYIRRHQPDIIVLDQLDKVRISKSYDANHDRLREVYTQAREVAKRYNKLVVGIGQASNDAEGKTIVTPAMAEGSKTGKYAEADVIVGIGMMPRGDSVTMEPDWTRYWTIGKNKVSAWRGTVLTILNPFTTTYRA